MEAETMMGDSMQSTTQVPARFAAGLPQMEFTPTLGWPVGGVLAVLMILAAVACVFVYVRTKQAERDGHGAASDQTLWGCVRRTLICLMIAMMTLTPSVQQPTRTRAVNATDVVVATDVTGSMAVKDARYGTQDSVRRIDAAHAAIDDLTGLYPDASFSALRFGASASVDVPLTPDTQAVRDWAAHLEPEATALSAGSSLDAPIDQLLVHLKSIRTRRAHDTIVLYIITDGEQTSPKARRSFSSLRQYIDAAFVVGVGSSQGGKIPEITSQPKDPTDSQDGSGKGNESEHWVNDPTTGQPGISVMDKKSLESIADELSGKTVFTGPDSRLDKGDAVRRSRQWHINDTYKRHERLNPIVWPMAIVTAVLLCFELGAWIATSRRLI